MFSNKEYLNFIDTSKKQGLDIVVASVTATTGHTYAKAGNMMLVNSNGEFAGVLGSPALQEKISDLAKEAIDSKELIVYENTPKDKNTNHGISYYLIQAFYFDENYGVLDIALNSFGKTLVRDITDGSYEIIDEKIDTKLEYSKFYQNIQKPYSLLIFGSGAHVSSLVSMANLMGWASTIIDMKVRESFICEADKFIKLGELDDILSMDLSAYDASVILSHSPKTDDRYLQALLKSDVEYIGILGNKKNMLKKQKEFNLFDDKRFFAPVGIDIGGITHQSIALSICSQIEARKNGKI